MNQLAIDSEMAVGLLRELVDLVELIDMQRPGDADCRAGSLAFFLETIRALVETVRVRRHEHLVAAVDDIGLAQKHAHIRFGYRQVVIVLASQLSR